MFNLFFAIVYHHVPHVRNLFLITAQVIQSDIGSDGMQYRTDRNSGDDPPDGSVVLDPIGSYSKIRSDSIFL
jgi:hypothetical protein